MNLYVFSAYNDGDYGTAVVYAHNADEARRLLFAPSSGLTLTPANVKLSKTIQLGRNPKAQIVASYFE